MRQLNPVDRARLAGAVRAVDPNIGDLPLLSLGYVASSDLPRAGEVVRLELKEFCTSAERLAWAKARGCRWDVRTCELLLKWERAHGCEWNEVHVRDIAAAGAHVEVLSWLDDNVA
jgi:hypothetical protein